MSGAGRDSPAHARESDRRRSLADQLQDVALEPRPGRDGTGGSFISLVEEAVPGIKAPVQRTIDRVDDQPRELGHGTVRKAISQIPFTPPASQDDALAREAAALVDERLWGAGSAAFRRHGCYDGDPEHQIALEALRLSRESQGERT